MEAQLDHLVPLHLSLGVPKPHDSDDSFYKMGAQQLKNKVHHYALKAGLIYGARLDSVSGWCWVAQLNPTHLIETLSFASQGH